MDNSDIPEDYIGRYMYEVPIHVYREPPPIQFYTEDHLKGEKHHKQGKLKPCGFNQYRFCSSGVGMVGVAVEVQFTSLQTCRKNTTREVITNPDMFYDLQRGVGFKTDVSLTRYCAVLIDSVAPPGLKTGSVAILSNELWKRLRESPEGVPGMGWFFLSEEQCMPREYNVLCDRCGTRLRYAAGESRSWYRPQDTLLPDEFSTLTCRMSDDHWDDVCQTEEDDLHEVAEILGGDLLSNRLVVPAAMTTYHLCKDCIPDGYTYCSACDSIHKVGRYSKELDDHREWIDSYYSGKLGDVSYRYQWEDGFDRRKNEPIVKSRTSLASNRLDILIKNIGRASLCSKLSVSYRKHLGEYLDELCTIWDAYSERYEKKHLQDKELELIHFGDEENG